MTLQSILQMIIAIDIAIDIVSNGPFIGHNCKHQFDIYIQNTLFFALYLHYFLHTLQCAYSPEDVMRSTSIFYVVDFCN